MKVLKFGGTSVGKPERMRHIAQLINNSDKQVVVLSALSGTTNSLVNIVSHLTYGRNKEALEEIEQLRKHYEAFIKELYKQDKTYQKGFQIVSAHFGFIETIIEMEGAGFTLKKERELLAQGELLSTKLFQNYLNEVNVPAVLLSALDFMRIDEYNEPRLGVIEQKLKEIIARYPQDTLFITQGYICKNANNEVDNLKRGGSDFTASLLGAALRAAEIQIWTDIDGMHNNDPRIVEKTFPIAELSFEEAAELAYFGAKILHPATIHPAKKYNIPVRLKNTMQPEAEGTIIRNIPDEEEQVKAVAAKDGIVAIKIKSSRMLLAYGFLRKIFEVFEQYKTPIDMITTSEVAVSITIDDDTFLHEITEEIKKIATIEVDENQSIVCVVGYFPFNRGGLAVEVFEAVKGIPVHMISYGASSHNISLLIDTQDKEAFLIALNDNLFLK
ncbi:aspartate kinase [Microscilla marina]|uniref:Aspartokinase n=1 Tax=Microscilla marina ATCC 23134 TaxID=313606 RepID=A1ZLK8_MICM2|nr:aspartate kinase [Microscilla marina]EAY28762.1 lysine-sensitive aspartokinase III [Microscilla marina ATCC 23134]